MLIQAILKLKTPLLGSQQTKERVRRFRKTESGQISVDPGQFLSNLGVAAEALEFDISTDLIRVPDGIKAPQINLYIRSWRDSSGLRKEDFECVRTGTVLTIPLLIMAGHENDPLPPTINELHEMLSFMGAWTGLSPWGSKFNYGRFEVQDVAKIESSERDTFNL